MMVSENLLDRRNSATRYRKAMMALTAVNVPLLTFNGALYISGGGFINLLTCVLLLASVGHTVYLWLIGWPRGIKAIDNLLLIDVKMAEVGVLIAAQPVHEDKVRRLQGEIARLMIETDKLVGYREN